MKIDPRHLEILAAISDHGGLTEAANAIGRTQPSLSRIVNQLEARLGVKLFEPNRRPLQPTDFCLQLVQYGRAIAQSGAAASQFVAQFKQGQAGRLRVSGSPIFMDGIVAPILAAFQAEHPTIEIEQSYGYVQSVFDGLANNTLDLGIVPVRRMQVPENINFVQALSGRNVIACRVGHPLARSDKLEVSDVAKQSWIAPPPESPLYQDLQKVFENIGVDDIKVSFSGGSLSSVLNFLNGSDALTILPYSVVYRLGRQNTLAALHTPIGDPDRNLCLVTAKGLPGFPARQRLVAYLRNEMSALSDLMALDDRRRRTGNMRST